jgi:hypothetical protein
VSYCPKHTTAANVWIWNGRFTEVASFIPRFSTPREYSSSLARSPAAKSPKRPTFTQGGNSLQCPVPATLSLPSAMVVRRPYPFLGCGLMVRPPASPFAVQPSYKHRRLD